MYNFIRCKHYHSLFSESVLTVACCCIKICSFPRLVKLTSPKLNLVIIVGAIVMYVSIITYSYPSYNQFGRTLLCNVSNPI